MAPNQPEDSEIPDITAKDSVPPEDLEIAVEDSEIPPEDSEIPDIPAEDSVPPEEIAVEDSEITLEDSEDHEEDLAPNQLEDSEEHEEDLAASLPSVGSGMPKQAPVAMILLPRSRSSALQTVHAIVSVSKQQRMISRLKTGNRLVFLPTRGGWALCAVRQDVGFTRLPTVPSARNAEGCERMSRRRRSNELNARKRKQKIIIIIISHVPLLH